MPDSPAGDPTVNEALFQRAIAVVLRNESGSLWQDPSGGLTRWGFALNENPDLTREDIQNMTRDEAIARYRDKWWTPGRYHEFPDDIAIKVFDTAVNAGPSPAVTCLQRALRAVGKGIKDDGIIGTMTITGANDCDAGQLLAALRSEVAGHHRLSAAARPVLKADLPGLLNRAYQ